MGGAVFPENVIYKQPVGKFPSHHSLQTPGLGERVILRRKEESKQRKLTQEGGVIIIPISWMRTWSRSNYRTRTTTQFLGFRLMLLFHYNINNERHVSTRCLRGIKGEQEIRYG